MRTYLRFRSSVRRWPVVFASLLLAVSGLSSEPTGASPYAGTFKGNQITITLAPTADSPSAYRGTIDRGEKPMPVAATALADRLKGIFTSEGDDFEFTATIAGDVLTLTTEGTTYRLKRRAVNPLARPGKDAGSQPAPAIKAPDATSAKPPAVLGGVGLNLNVNDPGAMRLKRVSIRDDSQMIGGEACSLLIPDDWKLEGGVQWRPHPALPAYLAFKVFNPRGSEVLEALPTTPCVWTEGGVALHPPGSLYFGNEVMRPITDPVGFIKQVVLPRFRPSLSASQIVATEDLPKVAEAIAAASQEPGLTKIARAARVRFQYNQNGKAYEEDFYCVLVSGTVAQIRTTFWGSERVCSFKAEKGKLDAQSKLLQTMTASAKVNLQWFNRYHQLVQMLVQNQLQSIRRTGELSRYIARTSEEISAIRQSAWENQQRSQDRISQNFSEYIRGVETYRNPFEDRPVELPSGYGDVWANSQGEYVLANDPNFNPNIGDNRNWQRLETTP